MMEQGLFQNSPRISEPSMRKWQETQGIDVIKGMFVEDLRKIPLKPWKRKGGLEYSSTCREQGVKMMPMSAKYPRVVLFCPRGICLRR